MAKSHGNRHEMPSLEGLLLAHSRNSTREKLAAFYDVSPQTITRWSEKLGAGLEWKRGRPQGSRNLI